MTIRLKTATLSWNYDENQSTIDMRGSSIRSDVEIVNQAMKDRPWRWIASGVRIGVAPDEPEVVLQFLGDLLARLGYEVKPGPGVKWQSKGDA